MARSPWLTGDGTLEGETAKAAAVERSVDQEQGK